MQLGTDPGVTLHVQELGSGPPLVLIHGLFGNLATWYFSAAPELAKSHQVIAYDLRGHGKSSRPLNGYDVASMARDLEAVVARVAGAGELTLVGHSYGGVVALAFALRQASHGRRVHKLAVIDAPLPPLDTGELWARFTGVAAEDRQAMLASLPGPVRDALASGGRRAKNFVEMVRFLSVESSLREDLVRAEMSDATLATLRCPVLAVYGAESACRASGQRLARVVSGARYLEMPGGHDLPQEAPLALTRELARFLVPPPHPSPRGEGAS